MSEYRLTPEAEDDLAEILAFIAQDDQAAARAVKAAIERAFQRLARHPGIGHSREDLPAKNLRAWPVYSFLIVYRARTRPLQILRVWSGWRDLSRAKF